MAEEKQAGRLVKRREHGNQEAADRQVRNDGLTLSGSDVFAERMSAFSPWTICLFFVKFG